MGQQQWAGVKRGTIKNWGVVEREKKLQLPAKMNAMNKSGSAQNAARPPPPPPKKREVSAAVTLPASRPHNGRIMPKKVAGKMSF